MRRGQLQKIQVGDVGFLIKMSWGETKRLQKERDNLSDDNMERVEWAERAILDHIVSCEGYEDEEGNPIVTLSQEDLDAFPPDFLQELTDKVLNPGGSADVVEGDSGNA